MNRGINRYERLVKSGQLLNLNKLETLLEKTAQETGSKKTCIFLSHMSGDKEAVKRIARYINDIGIDIYLDVDDVNLQQAVQNNDHISITKFIELGIVESTHLMSIISKKTKNSWWVPYEIGYARSIGKQLSTLKLSDVEYVPSFLKITTIINGTKSLNEYLCGIRSRLRNKLAVSRLKPVYEGVIDHNQTHHPLDDYLNWNG